MRANATQPAGPALAPALLFVVTAPLFAFAASLGSVLLDRQVMHRMLDDLQLAERARGVVVQTWFSRTLAAPGLVAPSHLVDPPPHRWEAVGAALLPAGWLNAEAHRNVDAFFDWLAGDDPLPAVQIDLREVRGYLRGPEGAQALLPLLADARPCLPGEAPIAEQAAAVGAGVFVPCIPPGVNLEALARQTATISAEDMPRAVDAQALVRLGVFTPQVVAQLDSVRAWARWWQSLLALWRNFCLLLLALTALASARTWAALLESPAPPLAVAGGVSLLIAPVLLGLALAAAGPALEPFEAGGPLLLGVVGYLSRAVALRLAAWGGGMVALALAGWWAARVVRARSERLAEPLPVRRRRTL